MYRLLIIVTLVINRSFSEFPSHRSDYGSYGLKIAGNDIMLVEVLDDIQMFLIRFGRLNDSSESVQCSMQYNDSSEYIYSVGIGKKQSIYERYIFYAGERTSRNSLDRIGTFVGLLVNKDQENSASLFNCDSFAYESIEYISSYGHQEYFVFGVEPNGQYAIGLAKDFIFIYRPFSKNRMWIKESNEVWPNNTTFVPVSVDTHDRYTVVAGFIVNGPLFRVHATPTIYTLSNSDLSVLSAWSYTAVQNSWQSYLTYSNLKMWSNKYIMSVNINPESGREILVGMSFLNIVFLLTVNSNGSDLRLSSFIDNGDLTGFGKSVAWLTNSEAAILISNYPTDDSSKIYLYSSLNNKTLPSMPSAVFPNVQQTFPISISTHLVRMISTPNSLAILNSDSEILIILPSLPGYFSSTDLCSNDSIFMVSQSKLCMAGTYKADTGIFPCSLCPSGTKNIGKRTSISCVDCSRDSFCPIGSATEINESFLISRLQARLHPRSPEVTVFDEILLQNMFSTNSGDHCILISPLFWVLIVIGLVFVILLIMGVLKQFVNHPRKHQARRYIKRIFRQTDLIHEGEMWIGGLVSFAIVLLFIFAYTFSASFYREYPTEDAGPQEFGCHQVVRNVKYESGLQSLSIPVSTEEQIIFDLLNQQDFILRLDLLNTVAACQNLFVQQMFGSTTARLMFNCTNSNGILSVAIKLPSRKVTIKWTLNDIALVGALRVQLLAREQKRGKYKLQELDFSQTFYDQFNRTLAQLTTINLEWTKAINETEPLTGHDSTFSGIWYPLVSIDENHTFLSSDEYATSANLTLMKVTMTITESSYYIKNRQLPIAKLNEIIFHNLLFTVVCLEIFRLAVLLFKLLIVPQIAFIRKYFQDKKKRLSMETTVTHHDITTPTDLTTNDEQSQKTNDYDSIQFRF